MNSVLYLLVCPISSIFPLAIFQFVWRRGCSIDNLSDRRLYFFLDLTDANTITRSSSWKDRLASVFGGGSAASLSTSSSSDSLSSIRTTPGGVASSRAINDLPEQSTSGGSSTHNTGESTSRYVSSKVDSIVSTSIQTSNQAPPPTPAFKIVEDSFIQANSTYPDCSFVPRTSFEGDSVDLANVPIWPPPPGVILISPRQSPNKPFINNAHVMTGIRGGRTPMSAQKRQLHDVEEDDDIDLFDGGREGKYGSIRIIPRLPLESAMTPGRRIAALPKKMSIIAASPPRFDLEAPPLPSFATVANQAIFQQDSMQSQDVENGNLSSETVTMGQEKDAIPSSDTLESIYHNNARHQPFVFGSPRQIPLTDDSFLKRIDGFAIAKQLEELQRRTGNTSSSSSSKNNNDMSVGADGKVQKGFVPRTTSNGNLQSKNGVRFEGKHAKEFKM